MHRYRNNARVRSGEKLLRSNNKILRKEVVKMNNTVPTDSVLKRHYEATHGQKSSTNKATKKCSGGILDCLKKIFGG